MKWLVAIPVFNEAKHVVAVLNEVRRYADDILAINDGSTDGSGEVLFRQTGIHLINHKQNLGYGAALRSAFGFAQAHDYDVLVTMDADGQHEAACIPCTLKVFTPDVDLVSGSRYLQSFRENTEPPADRRRINHLLTTYLNQRFGLNITDAFCGFKAYRVKHLRQFRITENGYGMPLQVWVQAANLGMRVKEIAVPLVYLDANRSFGALLDDPDRRLAYYKQVIEAELNKLDDQQHHILEGLDL